MAFPEISSIYNIKISKYSFNKICHLINKFIHSSFLNLIRITKFKIIISHLINILNPNNPKQSIKPSKLYQLINKQQSTLLSHLGLPSVNPSTCHPGNLQSL